jgi:ABC-type lipoprotein export system ATPase subunit
VIALGAIDERMPVVRCEEVVRRYRTAHADVLALDRVDLDVRAGTLVAVAGSSGSGKSTLLSLVGCIDRPTSGVVLVDGVDVGALGRRQRRRLRRQRLSTILPQPSDNLFDHLDVAGNVRWMARRRGLSNLDVAAALDPFGIAESRTKSIRQLSGGEQQRLALACALVGSPAVVLADEPTASLDRTNALVVVAALRDAVDRGATVLVATHDHDVVDAADHVVHLAHGSVVQSPRGGGR